MRNMTFGVGSSRGIVDSMERSAGLSPAYLVPNTYDEAVYRRSSEALLAKWAEGGGEGGGLFSMVATRIEHAHGSDEGGAAAEQPLFRIGYASGGLSHQRDFQEVRKPLKY
jgi:hypothetical protein